MQIQQVQIALAAAGGGAVGAVLRLLLGNAVRAAVGDGFPAGTFVVNAVGCLLFGWCWALADGTWSRPVTAAVFAGFFGAFTTFSTFAFESLMLWEQGRPLACAANVIGQNLLGGAAMILGLWLGRAT